MRCGSLGVDGRVLKNGLCNNEKEVKKQQGGSHSTVRKKRG